MITYKEHTQDGVKFLTLIDTNSGEVYAFDSANHQNYDNYVKECTDFMANNPQASLKELTETFVNENEKLRKKHGIHLDSDKMIINLKGKKVELPAEVGKVFKNVKKEKDIERLLSFAESLSKNPYEHTKESLIEWIVTNPSLIILDDGRIQGYRSVGKDYHSLNSGYGIVNNIEYNGTLDNTPGNILEFPREMIDHNPLNRCSIGLHVGTLNYALNYARWGKYVTVAFSAEDVVSTVSDARQNKIRVCKMEILQDFTEDKQFIKNMS